MRVVDRFSKYNHFIPLGHLYTTNSVARAFFDDIVHLHGIPTVLSSAIVIPFLVAIFGLNFSILLVSSFT